MLTVVFLATILWAAGPSQATFPGRNGLIVFDTENGPPSQIYTIRPDGAGLRQLTAATGGQGAIQPRWAADGRTIVYVSDESGNPEIYVIHSDGTGQRQLTTDPAFGNFSPSFSPDGSRVVFSRCSHYLGTCDIAGMRSDGRQIRSLLGGYWHHGQPVFSPDGRRIAFSSDQGGYDSRIWVMNANASQAHPITRPVLAFVFAGSAPATFAGHNGRIAFTGCLGRSCDIYTANPDGTTVRQVTRNGSSYYAAWSPDGKRIAYTSAVSGALAIWIEDANGAHARQLTPDQPKAVPSAAVHAGREDDPLHPLCG